MWECVHKKRGKRGNGELVMRICRKCRKAATTEGKICRACGAILEEVPDAVAAELVAEGPPPPRLRVRADDRESASARPRPPLGLPSGSIRALLTLLIVGVVVIQVVQGQKVEALWTETLMIVLAHYFTSRRLVSLPPAVVEQMKKEGRLEAEAQPLYLPRNSIRALLVLAFVGLGVYLFEQGRLFESDALSILVVVFAYFLGLAVRVKNAPGWEDLKAAVVLIVLIVTAFAYVTGNANLVHPVVRNAALVLVLFYFGSR